MNSHRKIVSRSPLGQSRVSKARRPGLGLVFAGTLIALALHMLPTSAEIIDRVVATVNDEMIALSDLQEAVDVYQHQFGRTQPGSMSGWDRKALERKVLEDLIDKKLIESFAKKMGIEASEDEFERAIQDVLARAHITEEQLREALEKDGIRYEEYRDEIRDQIIKAKMIQQEIRAHINIKEQQIEEYYLDHPEEFRAEEGVVLRHILFPLPKSPHPEVIEATRKEAIRVKEAILEGLPYEEAARRYSQDATAAHGGWLGFFRKGALSPEMEAAAESLQEGEISDPVLTPLGIHLVKLEERTSGDLRPLEKVRQGIQEQLYEEAAERQFEEWRKDLRKNAHIEVFL